MQKAIEENTVGELLQENREKKNNGKKDKEM